MASSGGGGAGGDVPAERAAAAVNDLIEVREGAVRLKSMLQAQSSPWTELMDGILNKLSSALSALNTGAASAGGQSSAAGSDGVIRQSVTSSSRNSTRKRSLGRRSLRHSSKRVTASLDDGHVWRKYGQKEIQNSPHPRSYYRCTHKSDQGCSAKRHVELCDTDPSKYVVTYYGEHTCRDPSTIPMVIDTTPGTGSDCPNNLISFASDYTNAAGGTPSQLVKESSATQLSSSWCTSDDVFISSAEPIAQVDELTAVVGSAGMTSSTVGSAPEYGCLGDMAVGGGGTGSIPSSPSSLGFVSIGDDDLFRFDP